MFEPDALGITARENKTGEIWLYVPRGARRISILHDELGIMRNYFYPEIIEKGTVYEMTLNTGDSQDKPVVENNMQFFVLRPEPASANVYIDDEQVPIENGLFSATMPKGEHTYRVEAPMYQADAGIVTLGDEQVIKSVTLKPKFGYMEIFSLPVQDADVYIDSVKVGSGGYTGTTVDIRCVLREALLKRATGMALCHNHPSGSLKPSLEDDRLTKSMASACAVMNIRFLDHIIFTDRRFYSYKDEGRL